MIEIIEELRQAIRELERRQSNILRAGHVVAVDPVALVCRWSDGELTTGWVRWLTRRAGRDRDWWCPSIGEQALLLSPDGEPNQGWVLPAGYTDAHPAPDTDPARHVIAYEDGMRIVHQPGRLILDGWDAGADIELRARNVVIKTGEGGYYHLDHAGYATRITHLGGAQYRTESWQAGAVAVGLPDHGHHPPEVDA